MQKQQKNSIECNLCGDHIPQGHYPIHKVRCSMKKESKLLLKESKISHLRESRHRKPRIFDEKKNQIKEEQEERIPCSFCGYMQTFAELDSHPNRCEGQQSLCQYCSEGYPKELMSEHESLCEANQQNEQQEEENENDPLERLMNLIDLINSIGNLVQRLEVDQGGLSEEKQKSLKKFKYKPSKQEELCTICYCQMQLGEDCIELKCKHIYHTQCISKWLEQSCKCPVCKQDQNKFK